MTGEKFISEMSALLREAEALKNDFSYYTAIKNCRRIVSEIEKNIFGDFENEKIVLLFNAWRMLANMHITLNRRSFVNLYLDSARAAVLKLRDSGRLDIILPSEFLSLYYDLVEYYSGELLKNDELTRACHEAIDLCAPYMNDIRIDEAILLSGLYFRLGLNIYRQDSSSANMYIQQGENLLFSIKDYDGVDFKRAMAEYHFISALLNKNKKLISAANRDICQAIKYYESYLTGHLDLNDYKHLYQLYELVRSFSGDPGRDSLYHKAKEGAEKIYLSAIEFIYSGRFDNIGVPTPGEYINLVFNDTVSIGDSISIAAAAMIYLAQGDFDKARQFIITAVRLGFRIMDRQPSGRFLDLIAYLIELLPITSEENESDRKRLELYREALPYAEAVLDIISAGGFVDMVTESRITSTMPYDTLNRCRGRILLIYSNIGSICRDTGDVDGAIYAFEKVMELTDEALLYSIDLETATLDKVDVSLKLGEMYCIAGLSERGKCILDEAMELLEKFCENAEEKSPFFETQYRYYLQQNDSLKMKYFS